MSTSHSPLPAPWQYYAARARQTDRVRVGDFGNGLEELLRETLEVIQSGVPFSDACRQRLDRIPLNRAKKHRRLRLYLRQRPSVAANQETSPLEVAESIEQVRGMFSDSEWEVECRLAAGQRYAEIALERGLSPEALKVRAARWRARIRHALPAIVRP